MSAGHHGAASATLEAAVNSGFLAHLCGALPVVDEAGRVIACCRCGACARSPRPAGAACVHAMP
jgi:hypothetical protein